MALLHWASISSNVEQRSCYDLIEFSRRLWANKFKLICMSLSGTLASFHMMLAIILLSSIEWTLGVGDGQGGLVCCSSWGLKESDMTEQLNWTDYSIMESIVLICNNVFF